MSTDAFRCLYHLPGFLLLAGAMVLVARHRRRSRRATRLGLVALIGLATSWVAWIGVQTLLDLYIGAIPRGRLEVVIFSLACMQRACEAGCVLLLAWAMIVDRAADPASGPEADYAEIADRAGTGQVRNR